MVVQDIEDFMVFEVEESGEKKRIKDISQQNLQSLLHSKQVLVIVRRDLKRIFIWKGSASPVQKRYISSRVAATIRQELSVGLKIVSVDQGDEPKEFLDAFDVYQLVPEGPMNEPNTFNWIERKITSSIMRISSKGINPTTLYWNGEKDTFTCSDNIKLHSEKIQRDNTVLERFTEFYFFALSRMKDLCPQMKSIDYEKLKSEVHEIISQEMRTRIGLKPTEEMIDERINEGDRWNVANKISSLIGKKLDKILRLDLSNNKSVDQGDEPKEFRTINREKPTREEISNRSRIRPGLNKTQAIIYKFNVEINQFEELVFIGEINRKDLLDSSSVFLIINFVSLNAWFDLQGFNVWLWYGSEISDTTKSIYEKIATEFLELMTPIEIFIIQENNEPYTFSYTVGHELYTDPKLEEINAKYDTVYIKILNGYLSVCTTERFIERAREITGFTDPINYTKLKELRLKELRKILQKENDQILNDQDLKQWIIKNKDILKYTENFPKPKRIGFWKTSNYSEIEPHMDEEWSKTEQRDIVLFYLRSGLLTAYGIGSSLCRVCHTDNGRFKVNSIDNKWHYPDGYPHYIASHMVKPPKELINDALEWFEENKLKIKRIFLKYEGAEANEIANYHGKPLIGHECNALIELEHLIGFNQRGFKIQDNHIVQLSLGTRLTSLPDNICSMTSLISLDLSLSSLISLPESIGNLTSLETLNLTRNHLTSLPESIGDLTSLKTLQLGVNQLMSLPESIGNLTSLKWLDLGGNQFTSLPESIGNLKSLKDLNLSGNPLTSLPESIGKLTSLETLILTYNSLTSLPESIGDLTSLKTLELGGNPLTSLPESIGNLTTLKNLNLSYNSLTSLPESIGDLTSLKKLQLGGNHLTSLPESIGKLTSLEILMLCNPLRSFPEGIGDLTSLEALNLTGNPLTSLPESIGKLTSLTYLNLIGNNLSSLPESIGDLTSLKALDLTGNPLTSLPESIGKLTSLKTLQLGGNPLTSLPESIGNLTSLQCLNLPKNLLPYLPKSLTDKIERKTVNNLIKNMFPIALKSLYDKLEEDFGLLIFFL